MGEVVCGYDPRPQRGFALLLAVILASVALSIGLALLDVAYKQVVLASSAKQSQTAFYAADSVMECVLYYDQQQDTFDYSTEPTSGAISCNGQGVSYTATTGASPRVTTLTVPCPAAQGGGTAGIAKVYKSSNAATQIFTTGYNTCDASNTRRIERGLKVTY